MHFGGALQLHDLGPHLGPRHLNPCDGHRQREVTWHCDLRGQV